MIKKYNSFIIRKQKMPKPQKFVIDDDLEEGTYTPNRQRVNTVYLGLSKETWLCIGAMVVTLPIIIAILAVTVHNDKKTTTSAATSGLDGEMLTFLISNSESAGCIDSLTTNPIAICDRLCEKEFCTGPFQTSEPCTGNCKQLHSSSLADCKASCLCCGSYHDCLLKNANDAQHCETTVSSLLPGCKFGDPGIPVDTPDHICLPQISTNYCPKVGCGFNIPISCSST